MEVLDLLSSEVGKYRLVGFFLWFIEPPTVSMLSPTGEGRARGVDLIEGGDCEIVGWGIFGYLLGLTNHVFSI